MVLTLKRWKSRSSPGIKAGAYCGKTHSQVKGPSPTGAGPFGVFGLSPVPRHPQRGKSTALPPANAVQAINRSRLTQTADYGDAGWSSPVARQAHNLKVAGSNPAPATNPQRSSGRIYQMWFGVCRRGPFWVVVSAPLDGPAPKHAHSLAREVVGIGPRLPNRSRAWRTRASSCAALICLPSYFVCYDCGPGGG